MLGKQPGSRAFSLMEILIAIGIIIIFITLPVLAFSNYSKSSRDQKRKSDVLKVSQALEQYKAQKGTYPLELSQLVTEGFLPELPLDPKDGQQIPGEADGITYGYSYESDGTTYELSTRLEQDVNGRRSGSGSGDISNVTGLSGSFSATAGTASGQSVTGTVNIAGTVNAGGTTMTSGTLSGPVSGAGVSGNINVSLENIPTTGNASGSVTGTCSVQGTVTGSTFSNGEIISCTITGVGPAASGPGVFIVTPDNPGGDENPIPELTLIADAEPTAPIPTDPPFVSPTSGIGASITPIPCNQTIVCTGPCQPLAGRCAPASYASTQSGCNYTTRSGSTNCSQAAAPNQACSISSQTCTNPLVCVGTYCQSPTPTPTRTPTPTPTRTPTPSPTPTVVTWARYVSDPNEITISRLITTSDGGYLTVGSRIVTGGFPQDADTHIIKYSSTGNVVWTKTVSTGTYAFYGSSVIQTTDNKFLIAGASDYGQTNSNYQGVLYKINSAGTTEWSSSFAPYSPLGQSVDLSSSYNTAVRYWSQTESGVGILNTNTSGGAVSYSKYDGYTGVYRFLRTSDGGYVMGVGTASGDYGVLKLDSSLNPTWLRVINGGAINHFASDLIHTGDGGYVVVGSTGTSGLDAGRDLFIAKLNSAGTFLWGRAVGSGGEEGAHRVVETNDGYVAVGYSQMQLANNYIVKVNTSGVVQWITQAGSPANNENPTGIVYNSADNSIVMAGETKSWGSGAKNILLVKISAATGLSEIACNITFASSATTNRSLGSASVLAPPARVGASISASAAIPFTTGTAGTNNSICGP